MAEVTGESLQPDSIADELAKASGFLDDIPGWSGVGILLPDAERVCRRLVEAAREITAPERAALARESYKAVVRAEADTVERCIAIVADEIDRNREAVPSTERSAVDLVLNQIRIRLRAISDPATNHSDYADEAALRRRNR